MFLCQQVVMMIQFFSCCHVYFRCKLFYKKGKEFADKGLGMMHLKPVEGTKKTQILVRAETSLGNILLNVMLNNQVNLLINVVHRLCYSLSSFSPTLKTLLSHFFVESLVYSLDHNFECCSNFPYRCHC